MSTLQHFFFFFFLNDPAPPEISTLPLHDALPICKRWPKRCSMPRSGTRNGWLDCGSSFARNETRRSTRFSTSWDGSSTRLAARSTPSPLRSEEHTSELQSQSNLVCRLLLEKKKKK